MGEREDGIEGGREGGRERGRVGEREGGRVGEMEGGIEGGRGRETRSHQALPLTLTHCTKCFT